MNAAWSLVSMACAGLPRKPSDAHRDGGQERRCGRSLQAGVAEKEDLFLECLSCRPLLPAAEP